LGERESDERSSSRPAELTALLSATETAGREAAWARFLAKYSRPILHTVYSRCSGYDSAMDRYAYILEKLQDEDFRRLRGYVADGRAEFSTWLAVVTRRLCEDFRRQRYGRPQSHTTEGEQRAREEFRVRRLLAELVGHDGDWSRVPVSDGTNPELALREVELGDSLAAAVSELGARDQLLLKLRFEYDLTAKQIAHLMGYPTPFHVYRRLRSRLTRLRRALEGEGVDDAAP
jgi:RNA polymerase sigma factor (sigma-70 family)